MFWHLDKPSDGCMFAFHLYFVSVCDQSDNTAALLAGVNDLLAADGCYCRQLFPKINSVDVTFVAIKS